MRLQKMATYRLIRILRAVLPVVGVILIGIPARNYWLSRARNVSAEPKTTTSAADLVVHTVGLTLSHSDGPKEVFRVTAKEEFFFKDNKHKLRDVRVVIAGDKPGDFSRIITGDQCTYDKSTGDIYFNGNVNAQLDATTATRTDELTYRNQGRVISSPVRTHVEQPGEMAGDADRLSYAIATELLTLTGNVHMKMSNGEALHADVAEFQKKENWTSVSGNVLLEASNGWLHGDRGRSDLQPNTYRPLNIVIDGDVTSESHSANSPDTLKTHSNSLTSILTPEGAIQHVFARGDVQAEQTAKGELQTITGAEVEAWINERGHVDNMEARRPMKPFAKMVGSGRSITSDLIRIKTDGSASGNATITTAEHSELIAGDSTVTTITGRAFTLVQGDTMTFDTSSFAKIDSAPKEGAKRTTAGDKTHVEINGKTNALIGLKQEGHFTFIEGLRSGSSDRAVFTDGGSTADLIGHFSFKEGTRSGTADRAHLTDDGNSIEMFDSVAFKDGSRHGTAAHARFFNGGDNVNLDSPSGARAEVIDDEQKKVIRARKIEMDQKANTVNLDSPTGTMAQVIDKERKLEIQARTIALNQATNSFEARTDVTTESREQPELVTVNAQHAKSAGDSSIQYEGNVVLNRGTTYIHADSLTPDKNNGFTAIGKVKSQMEGMDASADKLEYDDDKKTARYTGNVHALRKNPKKGPMSLDAADMTLFLDSTDSGKTANPKAQQNGQLQKLEANGRVSVKQGLRKGDGDHLVYDNIKDEVTLTSVPGSVVTTFDPVKGASTGALARWTGSEGMIHMEGGRGGRTELVIPK
jgi:lipopolysaccharide export system protein LptA